MIDQEKSLAYLYPEIAKEWHPTKNGELLPTNVLPGSNKKVWWVCEKGHEWEACTNNRKQGKGCPYCSGRRVLIGENDLLTSNPKLSEEWDYELNFPLRPENVSSGKNIYAHWICKKCGNKWKANINSRNRGAGCPKCAKRFHSSFPEQALFYYIHAAYPDAVNSYKDIFQNQMELDIYIPSIRTGIEYDGENAHTEKRFKSDLKKYSICESNKIKLIRVREVLYTGNIKTSDLQIKSDYSSGNFTALNRLINQVLEILHANIDCDVERDQIIILEHIRSKLSAQSLASEYPSIAQEWNYEKNGTLTPDMFFSGNGDRVWWRCAQGHEWKAAIQPRTKKGVGCPYCSNKKALKGFNDLVTTDFQIAAEWNKEKNENIKPDEVTRGSGKKVWWICPQGHEYQMEIYHRIAGHKCPFCVGSKAIPNENDFTVKYSFLLDEWDFDKNCGISPTDYLPGSEKKVWWVCSKCGNEWKTMIANRVKGCGCPECGKKLANQNALKSRINKGETFQKWCESNPETAFLLREWGENNAICPNEVTPKSYIKIEWKCSTCGYKWKTEIYKRANHPHDCPACQNKVVLRGYNDLLCANPELSQEWDYERNFDILPCDVVPGSSKKVWWRGKCGHNWQARVSNRAILSYGCPYCSGVKVLEGFNDLATTNPRLAEEWDFSKNDFFPNQVSSGSHKKAYWVCGKGHSWNEEIKRRNSGSVCPICAREKSTNIGKN